MLLTPYRHIFGASSSLHVSLYTNSAALLQPPAGCGHLQRLGLPVPSVNLHLHVAWSILFPVRPFGEVQVHLFIFLLGNIDDVFGCLTENKVCSTSDLSHPAVFTRNFILTTVLCSNHGTPVARNYDHIMF